MRETTGMANRAPSLAKISASFDDATMTLPGDLEYGRNAKRCSFAACETSAARIAFIAIFIPGATDLRRRPARGS